ncbi:MAG: VOC family protein [Actinobacteria bacterium]|nr:VOC family protein [Actinomycetota bacterium]
MRLDHVTITAGDLVASLEFYDAALGALGLVRVVDLVDEEEEDPEVEAAGWGPVGGPALLWVVTGPGPTVGAHLRLRADSRSEVEAFYAAAVTAGGRAHDAPRRWTVYRTGEFNAIVADPDGNLIEVVAPE